jgi:hypothetical protein
MCTVELPERLNAAAVFVDRHLHATMKLSHTETSMKA